jgi:hypothetical protein
MADDAIVTILEDDIDALKSYVDKLRPEKKARIANALKHVKTGLYSVAPITCPGYRKCPFQNHCPIPDIDENGERIVGLDSDYPINRPCILESTFIKQKTIEYIRHLKVDGENPVEMGLVNELALIDLYKNRAAMILSAGDRSGQGQDFLLIDRTEQDNGNGEDSKMIMSTSTQLHPALTLIDQLEKRREKLLSQLLQTRKAQTEISIKMGKKRDESQLIDELKKVRELLAAKDVPQITTKEELIPIKD